jgi:hypothetical protein
MSSLKSTALLAHIEDHCVDANVRKISWSGRKYIANGFYKVVTPLHVFKKVYVNRVETIANLVIPAGAMIYAEPYAFQPGARMALRKMRASEAFVHSLVKQRMGTQVQEANSHWDPSFTYKVGETVKPNRPFSKDETQCDHGIHFFINLADAKRW